MLSLSLNQLQSVNKRVLFDLVVCQVLILVRFVSLRIHNMLVSIIEASTLSEICLYCTYSGWIFYRVIIGKESCVIPNLLNLRIHSWPNTIIALGIFCSNSCQMLVTHNAARAGLRSASVWAATKLLPFDFLFLLNFILIRVVNLAGSVCLYFISCVAAVIWNRHAVKYRPRLGIIFNCIFVNTV